MSDYDTIEIRVARIAGEQVWTPTFEGWHRGAYASWREGGATKGVSLDLVLSKLSPDEYAALRPRLEEMAKLMLERVHGFANKVTTGELPVDEVVKPAEATLRCAALYASLLEGIESADRRIDPGG